METYDKPIIVDDGNSVQTASLGIVAFHVAMAAEVIYHTAAISQMLAIQVTAVSEVMIAFTEAVALTSEVTVVNSK